MTVLLAGLVDDAGLFPPTALPMLGAVARHRADLVAGEAMLTHRFLCLASRIGELRAELADGDRFRLGLIADSGGEGLDTVVATIAEDPRLSLAAVEFPLARTGQADPADALSAACAAVAGVSEEVPLFVEPARLSDVDPLAQGVAVVREGRIVGVKLRCGGSTREHFPTPVALAAAVESVAAHAVVMKATAGLHRAVRHTDPETGFDHHGYLNLLLAIADAVRGAGTDAVAAMLESNDGEDLVRRAAALDERQAAAVRDIFFSYGSCDTREPVHEARALGLASDRTGMTP